jgi:hypothetical protein
MKKTLFIVIALAIVLVAIAYITTPSQDTDTATSTASLTLISPVGGTIDVGEQTDVRWVSNNYSSDKVAVNIIRKVSSNPNTYELVRTVTSETSNDGSAVWVPAVTDAGDNTFVEIACVESDQACTASTPVSSLAVINTGAYANTAAVYDAIEKSANN